jgi:hypothetical protein
MDWTPFLRDLYAAFGVLGPTPEALVWSDRETRTTPAVGDPRLVELALVDVVYDFIASRSYCVRCGSPLGLNLNADVLPAQDGAAPWSRVSVRSRCRGWRRHLHTALIVRTADGLDLGQFHM